MNAGQIIRQWQTGQKNRMAATVLPVVVSWLLIILLAYLLAGLAWKVAEIWFFTDAEAPEIAAVGSVVSTEGNAMAGGYSWKEYGLFGKEPAAGAPLPAKPKVTQNRKQAPAKPVRLTLFGTLAATNPEDAMAVLSADGQATEIYRPGDELQAGVVLKSVDPWSVIVLVGDQEQLIPLVEESQLSRTIQPARIAPAPAEADGKTNETRVTSPEVVAKIAEYRQALAANPVSMVNKVRAYAVRREGAVYGYRLRPGTDRALLGQMGLRSGDILISLNGMAVNDAKNLPDIMANLKDQPELLMELERGGERQELRVVMETGQ